SGYAGDGCLVDAGTAGRKEENEGRFWGPVHDFEEGFGVSPQAALPEIRSGLGSAGEIILPER
ncbi:TPA: hypothetical protein ACLEX3_001004, partial [Pseudomonas aeruginosa]